MACPTPSDVFRQATENLGNEIFLKASHKSIALNLFPREEYPRGKGLVHSTFTMGRSFPTTDEPAFEQIAFSANEVFTGTCTTTYKDVPVGFDEDTYSPEKFGWKGPTICPDDLIHSHNIEDFLNKYIMSMSKHTDVEIGNRLFAINDHYVPKAIVLDADLTVEAGGTGHPPTSPDLTYDEAECELSQDFLDEVAQHLMEEGVDSGNTDGWIQDSEEGPVFPLMIGPKMSKRLLLNNSELRQDYRDAFTGQGEVNPVIRRLGAARVIGNFRHIITRVPPRYTYAGGEYTRVPTWVSTAATKGFKAEINPNWKIAPFEGARVLSPLVFTDQIIKPVNSAAGLQWSPRNYTGDWHFVTGGSKVNGSTCLDPLDKLAAHFAEYQHAAKPVHPEFGMLIIFKRCLDSITCVTCET